MLKIIALTITTAVLAAFRYCSRTDPENVGSTN